MSDLKQVIDESFIQYAGATLQSRALVDVRDCLKPSARQIFYCLYTDKFLPNKPFKKTLKAIGSIARLYIHGDSSAEGVIMRAGQPFAMRYPLVEVEGNGGNLIQSGNWAAVRYTASRLSDFAICLFNDIDKKTISDWRDNYDDTEQYPVVLPTKGFYNIVNGTMGIGIGAACSIPQFNIKDVNNALCTLLDNPDVDFEDIYCAPDFATGAILLNESEVKESLKHGQGFACKLRAVVDFDTKDRCLVVTEIPYSVYTNTICGELEKILESPDNPGIDRFNDLTNTAPLIKIYLTKNSNPDKVLRFLYKNTSLQSHYGVNMTMLKDGRFPMVYGWKEALQAHIDHEKIVYRRGYEFDLEKAQARLHIVEGLLICLASIDEVVKVIKNSTSTADANANLCKQFLLDDIQAKAVLDMKLSRLAHLEVQKVEKEKAELLSTISDLNDLLTNTERFNNELKKAWRSMAEKYGDARRTRIMSIEHDSDQEPTEIKTLQLSLTNKNNLFVNESSTLYTQRRGGVGTKLKLDSGEYVIESHAIESNEELLFFTQKGDFYHCSANELSSNEKLSVYGLFNLSENDRICAFTALNKKTTSKHIIFFTKNGIAKKSLLSEYNIKRKGALKAITLDINDEIVNVIVTDNDNVGLLTEMGNFLVITTNDIRPIGRVARGIKAIKLNDGDYVVGARAIPAATKAIISISKLGLIKQTDIKEFTTQGKNTKGSKLQKLNENDAMSDFYPLTTEPDVLVASTSTCIKIAIKEIPVLTKNTMGNKAIKLGQKDFIIGIS